MSPVGSPKPSALPSSTMALIDSKTSKREAQRVLWRIILSMINHGWTEADGLTLILDRPVGHGQWLTAFAGVDFHVAVAIVQRTAAGVAIDRARLVQTGLAVLVRQAVDAGGTVLLETRLR